MPSQDEIRAMEERLEELRPEVEEYEALEEANKWYEMLLYLEAEGFIEIDEGRVYEKGSAWSPNIPLLSQ